MPGHILLFLRPRDDQVARFQQWRKGIFYNHTNIVPHLYLDAIDMITEAYIYPYVNIYRFLDSAALVASQIEQQLHSDSAKVHLSTFHWQLYSTTAETRSSSRPAATVVAVGLTIPTDPVSHRELNEWYTEEHVPALATVPGWQAAIRLQLLQASTKDAAEYAAPYLAIHEWGEPNELGQESWKKANSTPGIARISDLQTAPIHRRVWKSV